MGKLKDYIKLLRPHQWIKNFFVFAALIFSANLLNLNKAITTLFAFIIFCMTSSSIYIINDILDREYDKKHPLKRLRPIASGRIKVKHALILFFILTSIL